ncbi:MAG: YgiQ family radical SAM protein [Saprospiraceae bacterium]|nr:YgiQ family radical SAM protein [Saprospiraceae bacterium]
MQITDWLPITAKEVQQRGWDELDVILVTGDAYVDHPAFGAAVIGRLIESKGLKVAILPQPNWQDDLRDFKKFGRPRLFFGVTSGNMDSMVNHYTANKRLRSDDAYTPGGQSGFRPDYAAIVYTKILKQLYPDIPIVLGGIEASLRRLAHYDYWSDSLKPGILIDSGADILLYGMAEKALSVLLEAIMDGHQISELKSIPQTAYITNSNIYPEPEIWSDVEISGYEKCLQDKLSYARNFKIIEQESNKMNARRILQKTDDRLIVVNPPFPPMTETELDRSFDLPYTRLPHPKYNKRGTIPAWEMIKFSINMHRGCFGGCSFCTISAHQGKFVVSRSKQSIMRELDVTTKMDGFKGYISDLGGPSANMYRMKGKDLSICAKCSSPSCISPKVCDNLDTDHNPLLEIYESVDKHPAVKKAFIGSGIRYDLLVNEFNTKSDQKTNDKYLERVVLRHTSGRLKVAPEHTSDQVLRIMRKPSFSYFRKFKEKFDFFNKKHGMNQPLIPYFISSHPGGTEESMAELAAETKDLGFKLEQVQDFTPTPMTVATVIYYSGVHPYTLKPVETTKKLDQKKEQNLFFFWYKSENRPAIISKLRKMDREDLISRFYGEKPFTKPKTGNKAFPKRNRR